MKIAVHSTNSLFQSKFQNNFNHFNRHELMFVTQEYDIEAIHMGFWMRIKKSDSDSATLENTDSFCNPGKPWKTPYEAVGCT